MIRKTITYLVIITLVGGILELGYFLGFSIGKKEALKWQGSKSSAGQAGKSLIDVKVLIGNNKTYDWIQRVNSLPMNSLIRSDWITSIRGELVSIEDNSIILKIDDSVQKLIFPSPIKEIKTIKFSKYIKVKDEYSPNSIHLEDLVEGDVIGVDTTIETLNGKIKLLELVKIVDE